MKQNTIFRSALLSLFLATTTLAAFAQDGGQFDVGADIYTRYVWRGTDFGNSPAMQPWATYSNSGFTVGAWGSYSINSNSMQEADLFVSYDIKDVITLTVTDYFFPNGTSAGNRYFDFAEETTGHVFEGTIAFNGLENLPLTLMAAMNFYGADSDNSLYFELGYGGKHKEIDYNIFAGAATGNYYLYGKNDNNFGLVNLGINLAKEISITENFALPVNGSLIFNPTAESIFIVFGISF